MDHPIEWVRVAIEGGILLGLVKALVHIGALLQEVKNIKEGQVDQGKRIHSIEQFLMGAHK